MELCLKYWNKSNKLHCRCENTRWMVINVLLLVIYYEHVKINLKMKQFYWDSKDYCQFVTEVGFFYTAARNTLMYTIMNDFDIRNFIKTSLFANFESRISPFNFVLHKVLRQKRSLSSWELPLKNRYLVSYYIP